MGVFTSKILQKTYEKYYMIFYEKSKNSPKVLVLKLNCKTIKNKANMIIAKSNEFLK